jgi:hypothetical protein
MLHVLRALFLLLLMGLGQAETAFALACEAPAGRQVAGDLLRHTDHTPCTRQHADDQQSDSQQGQAPHDDTPGRNGPHEGANCAAMLACGVGLGLPAELPAVTAAARTNPAPFTPVITPPSRTDIPGNPPPRA